MSASRNLGVRHATGPYIAFLDADDVWLPDKLERQVAVLEANPGAALVHGPLLEWHTWSGDPAARDRLYGVGRTGEHPYAGTVVPPPKLVALFLAYQEFIPSGSLLRRAAMEQVDGFEDHFRGNFEDAVLYVKLGLAFPICVARECSYWYRLHPGSWSRTTRRAGHSDTTRLRFLEWAAGYLSAQQITDPATWRALRLATRRARHPWSRVLEGRYLIERFDAGAKAIARRLLPAPVHRWLSARFALSKVSLRGPE